MITAYRHPDRAHGRARMGTLIDSTSANVASATTTGCAGPHPWRLVRSTWASALALVAIALTACSGGQDPTPHPQVAASDSAVRVVRPDDADLVRYVSNQSVEDEDVRVTLAVDGVMGVDGEFRVETQHHWIRFPLGLHARKSQRGVYRRGTW